MSPVNTEKKLELVRSIRMQNQYNRQLCRRHEQLLYAGENEKKARELYSLEEATLPKTAFFSTAEGNVKEGSLFKGLRIRIVIAMLLFLGFVFCDRNGIDILGQNTTRLFEMLSENSLLSVMDRFMESSVF